MAAVLLQKERGGFFVFKNRDRKGVAISNRHALSVSTKISD